MVITAQFVYALYCDIEMGYNPKLVFADPKTMREEEYRVPAYFCESLILKPSSSIFESKELTAPLRTLQNTANSYLSTHDSTYYLSVKQFASFKFVANRNSKIPQLVFRPGRM